MVLNGGIKILIVSLLVSFAMACCPSSIVVFKLAPHNVDLEVWKGFKGDAYGNATFRDGKFILWVNDTSGGWGLAKICRGLMPHDWGLRYAPLDNEIIIDRNDELKLNLEFDVKLLSYKPFTASNSSVNVAVTFFWRGFNQPYHVKCYQTELQFFSYFGDGVKTGEKWFFTSPFGDEVAQFKIVDNLKVGAFKHYELDVMPHVKEMMTHFGLQKFNLSVLKFL